MPSTYTDRLGFEKQEPGENFNQWGERLNNALDLTDEAIAGRAAISLTGNYSLTNTLNESNQARKAALIFTDGGLSAVPTVTIPAKEKIYYVENRGATYAITFTAGGTTGSVPAGATCWVVCDGTNVKVFDPLSVAIDRNGLVRFDGEQTLTASQQEQVRNNIGAALAFRVNVMDFGAVADGVLNEGDGRYEGSDNTAAFQAALDAANTLRCSVFIPDGDYCFAGIAGTQKIYLEVPSWCVIRGQSMEGTRLLVDYIPDEDDYAPNHKNNIFFSSPNPFGTTDFSRSTYELFDIEELTVMGLHGVRRTNGYRTTPFRIRNTETVRISRVKGRDIPGSFASNQWNGRCDFIENDLDRIANVGLRSLDTPNTIYQNNRLRRLEDDSIDCHSGNNALGEPRGKISIVGNLMEDCEGIAVLGGRQISIVANTLRRTRRSCIQVSGHTVSEGRASMGSIAIVGNVIEDPFEGIDYDDPDAAVSVAQQDFSAPILIQGGIRTATTTSVSPGEWDSATGTVLDPWTNSGTTAGAGAMQTSDWEDNSNFGMFSVVVANNTITRTLPAVTNYSDYGFGSWWGRLGDADPAVTQQSFRKHVICIGDNLSNFIITGNTASGFRDGAFVYFNRTVSEQTPDDFYFMSGKVSNNIARDVNWGVASNVKGLVAPATLWTLDVEIDANIFDCDPYAKSSFRTSPIDGSWVNSVDGLQPAAANLRNFQGWKFRNNTCRNCSAPMYSEPVSSGQGLIENNIVECDPASPGYSASNKGVGNLPRASDMWRYMIVDSNPSSADWRRLKNICTLASTIVPTSGAYVVGHFVRQTNPTTSSAGAKIHLGWIRRTTGTAHVVGTDWIGVYPSTAS